MSDKQAAISTIEGGTPKVVPDVVIETRTLSKVYRDFWGRTKVQALKALDLQIFRG